MQNIFILGAYGQNNLGDDALLEVFLEQFNGADILVNSAQPEQTSRRYGVRALATYWSWPRLPRPRALLRSDLIVFGGGSLLKEIEGGLIARLLYFVRIFAILLIAKLTGRPTAMLGVGIGPLNHPLYRWLSREPEESALRRLPDGVRGTVEYALEGVAPEPAHMRWLSLVKKA